MIWKNVRYVGSIPRGCACSQSPARKNEKNRRNSTHNWPIAGEFLVVVRFLHVSAQFRTNLNNSARIHKIRPIQHSSAQKFALFSLISSIRPIQHNSGQKIALFSLFPPIRPIQHKSAHKFILFCSISV